MSIFDSRPRRALRALTQLHYRVRSQPDTPWRQALAVFIGVVVGCSPLFGLHLALCVLFAGLAGVNPMRAYLAASINNPFTAALFVYLELAVGHWVFTAQWPLLTVDEASAISIWDIGRDLLTGSLLVGLGLGALLGACAYALSARHVPLAKRLRDASADRYLAAGIFHWEFVRGKLKYDPLYSAILKAGLLPPMGRLLDLGCGRAILLNLLHTASQFYAQGHWEPDWPPPPSQLALIGIDSHAQHAAIARRALADGGVIHTRDLTEYRPSPCDAALLLDVLFYLPARRQRELIARVSAALRPGGVLLIRETDADAGPRFALTRAAERLCALAQGRGRRRHYYRGIESWVRLLAGHGLIVKTRPMAAGTPYANVLIEARKPVEVDPNTEAIKAV